MYDVRVAAFTNGGTGESPATRTRSLESGKLRVPTSFCMNSRNSYYWLF